MTMHTLTNKERRQSARRMLLMAIGTLLLCLSVSAQNNPYKINDQLYKQYQEAYRMRTSQQGVALARQMYANAVKMGDKKAQCVALTIPVIYYSLLHNDDTAFEQAVKQLQGVSLHNGYEQYYYYGFTNRVNYLINKHRLYDAYEYVAEIESDARKKHSPYGSFTALNALGQVHAIMSENGLAIECYQNALNYGLRYLKDQDMAPIYRKIAECYEELYEYPKMLEYGEKGYAVAKSPMSRLRAIRAICYASFMLGMKDNFMKYYDIYTQIGGKPNPRATSMQEREIAIIKLIYDGKNSEAEKYIALIPKNYAIHSRRLGIERRKMYGDYKEIAIMQTALYRMHINKSDSAMASNNNHLGIRIVNQLLTFENQRLELEHQRLLNEQQSTQLRNSNLELANTKLSLHNSSLELSKTKEEADIMRLSFNNKQLETEKLRGLVKAQHTRQRYYNTVAAAFGMIIAIILVAAAVYMRFHKKMIDRLTVVNKALARKHSELKIAKERAEAANNAKSAFILNMHNDIRTPLNNVVNSATIIANSSKVMTMKERANCNQQVQNNTQSLLKIVAEVLKKAQATT